MPPHRAPGCPSPSASPAALRRLAPLALCLSLTLGAVGAYAQATRKQAGEARSVGAVSEVKAQSDALLSAVDETTRQVSALRGLPLKAPFKRGILSRAEI